jgi:uncharacterized protein (TIGR03086 family)
MNSPHGAVSSAVLLEWHRRACEQFLRHVRQVELEQWKLATPCTAWDVRTLVNHVVSWNLIVSDLLAGKTPAEIAAMFSQDALGDNPTAAAEASVGRAIAAFGQPGALERIVHHPVGDLPASYVVMMRTFDNTLHGWDLARAIGADERIDLELADAVYEWALPQREALRASGAFAPEVEVRPDAGTQARLLGLLGHRP